ncbi:ubiquitin-conjugating enzyme E2 J2-like [Oppia nitens]|uniref:ubiquitin-conjugating enzyme E2 J2-like n=1 Tax=Oppia nitens TaxID=1686743 RepID=UPI0023DCB503|nr:ubiquitin-conjugating enzyme E2 J2-like [Oppia nitens]
MSSQVPKIAIKRLQKDYKELLQDPIPFVTAVPLESNILEWHYVLKGPPDSPYSGGIYHGTLAFPKEFPYKPPAIRMLTPNGRFAINTSLCLSMSEFHPETWSPLWTGGAVLNGLLSFMVGNERATGCVHNTDEERRQLAAQSWNFNLKNKTFCELFPDLAKEAKQKKTN